MSYLYRCKIFQQILIFSFQSAILSVVLTVRFKGFIDHVNTILTPSRSYLFG